VSSAANPDAHVALLLAAVLIAAKLGGEAATRLRQPAVLGELVAGIALGNLPWLPLREPGANVSVDMLSRLGVLILMFEVGLESTVKDILAVGADAARVAGLGTLSTFGAGWLVAAWLRPDAGVAAHAFLGASVAATSIGVSARVLRDLGQTRSKEARTILGAAVLDDVIALVLLALMSGWIVGKASGNAPTAASVLWIVGKTLGLLALAVAVGVRVTPSLFALGARFKTRGALLAIGLAFCFLSAWAADLIGLAPLVGAFAAGVVLEDFHSARFVERGEAPLQRLVEPLSGFFVPIFFVVMGIRTDLRAFLRLETLLLSAGLVCVAVVGKLACGLGARGVNRLVVAFGMMPRGEVCLIFASLGISLQVGGIPVIDGTAYSALVAVVVFTTLLTPVLLKWGLARPTRT
jgi:Kef-type K+ transport system membrane component KefB